MGLSKLRTAAHNLEPAPTFPRRALLFSHWRTPREPQGRQQQHAGELQEQRVEDPELGPAVALHVRLLLVELREQVVVEVVGAAQILHSRVREQVQRDDADDLPRARRSR